MVAMGAALDMMGARSPQDAALVGAWVDEIREGERNWSNGGSRVVEIDPASWGAGPAWAGSSALHEAVHVKNWFTNDFPVYGCAGEEKSLRAQADYLDKVGYGGSAAYVRSLIGVWC